MVLIVRYQDFEVATDGSVAMLPPLILRIMLWSCSIDIRILRWPMMAVRPCCLLVFYDFGCGADRRISGLVVAHDGSEAMVPPLNLRFFVMVLLD